MQYKDSHGVTIVDGDILKYEEMSTKSIEEAIMVRDQLHTRTHVAYPKWTKQFESCLIPIQYAGDQQKLDKDVIQIKSLKIIGNVTTNPDRLEPAYATALWGE